ncbi:putative baseplate assembly protein [Actinoplanes solisilvae]|uniref:putative baseplate assembly protein n=1 Tax=Actinoplanes solisilvae TaxID=2486853 RepID=UPI000FDCD8CF|nr:putative baseplate assembly protein [Actinoplanes solisilvae]
MALIGPILDDRSFEQLRDELVKRIPVYAPEWTDHNESDPGVALLELFAFLGETLLYRFNQIPDATKVSFLRLLGVRPRPAQPARALLALRTEEPGGVPILRDAEAKAGAVSFETEDEVYVWPLQALAVGKRAVPAAQTAGDTERRDDAIARLSTAAAPVDPDKVKFYETVAVPDDPLAPDATILDVNNTLDRALWIALLGEDTTDVDQLANRTLFVGFAMDEQVTTPFDLDRLDDDEVPRYRSTGLGADPPAMLWRLWNGPPATRTGAAFTDLQILGDTTAGLVRGGVVKVAVPPALPRFDPLERSPGDLDNPPPLEDEEQAARVVAWLQIRRPQTENDSIGGVRWVGLNAVSAVQARTAGAELLGTGSGDGSQRFALTQRPVLRRTVRLQVEEPDGWRDWQETDDFTASSPDDRHYVVDLTAGEVEFGARTRVPQIGERIRVLSYRYGGGRAGSVAAGAITRISGTAGVTVSNPLPAAGGADAAPLTDAMDSIPAEVHRRDRAVVADDFRDLALQVPGVLRAETLPLMHPDNPRTPAAGVISVLLFPAEDLRRPSAPMPDVTLLRRVAAYLDPRRLVTTELYVIPPTYKQISVSVGVRVRDGYQVDAVRRWVELILRQFLAPVPPYGPDAGGWPLGRAVRAAELHAVAVQVDGVEFLEGLSLAEPGRPPSELVELAAWEVPELTAITVVTGAPLPPGDPYVPAPPGTGPDVVIVPLPPEVC